MSGLVFPIGCMYAGQAVTITMVATVLDKIGASARVVTARDCQSGKGKYASAHDLRRAFGARWAKQVLPAVLQRLMRHRDIGTTMKYYVGIEADDVATDLWAKYRAAGNTVGNNQQSAADKSALTQAEPIEGTPCDETA